MRKSVAIALLLALALFVTACSPQAPATDADPGTSAPSADGDTAPSTDELDKVIVGYSLEMNYAPLFAAIEHGFMAEQGIEVELNRVNSGPEAAGFLAQGSLDVGAVSLAAGIFNAFEREFDMRVVATAASWGPEHSVYILGSQSAIDNGDITTLADLEGKKFALPGGPGASTTYLTDAALSTVGLSIHDVELVPMSSPDIPLALKNQAVDGALTAAPFSTQAVSEGWAVPLLENWEEGASASQFIYSGQFMKERPEVAERFMVALLQGARAIQGDDFWSDKNMAIWTEYTGVAEDVIRQNIPMVYSPDMVVRTENILKQEQFHRDAGYSEYEEALTLEEIVDESFQQAALAKLGPYNP